MNKFGFSKMVRNAHPLVAAVFNAVNNINGNKTRITQVKDRTA